MIDKDALKDELVRLLEADLATARSAYASTEAGATHEEAKPENDKDTRALEQSYLARGQAARVEELRTAYAQATQVSSRSQEGGPAALGAVVIAEEDDREQCFYLAPGRGGATLQGGAIQVVTPGSPLGRALIGKRAGDECEVRVGPRVRALTIVGVH
jgi:transcription elongation GreA/GreB family factor